MIFSFIKKLSGNEIKVLMTIMLNCTDKNYEHSNLEILADLADLSYPTTLDILDALEKKNIVRKFDTGSSTVVRVMKELHYFVDHLKKCPDQLMLIAEDEDPPEQKKWWTKKDQDDLIKHYAKEKGVPDEKLKEWYRVNYIINIKPARRLLDYAGNLEAAFKTITNCRIERAKRKLDWSLGGDVLRNIQDYAPKVTTNGEKKWF